MVKVIWCVRFLCSQRRRASVACVVLKLLFCLGLFLCLLVVRVLSDGCIFLFMIWSLCIFRVCVCFGEWVVSIAMLRIVVASFYFGLFEGKAL